MALIVKDRVKESCSSPGTGTVTLLGAATGYVSFSVIGDGNTTYYCIADQAGNNWEVGIGTYTASGTTLSRDTVLSNSAGNTSPINFSSGTQDVFVVYPASRSVYVDSTTITPNISATLPASSGGTGQSSLTLNNVLLGNGTSAVQFVAPGTTGNLLTSDGTTWQSSAPPSAFPSGTAMLFVQTTAPTGWTKSTTHDNKALRIVSGTASSGGSVAFTTVFSSARAVTVSGTVANTTAGGSVSTTVDNTTAGGSVSTTINNTTAGGTVSTTTTVDNTTAGGSVSTTTTVTNTTAGGTVSTTTTVTNTTAGGTVSTTVDNTAAGGSVSTTIANTTAAGTVSTTIANTTAAGTVSTTVANTTAAGTVALSGGSIGATTLTTSQIPSHQHYLTLVLTSTEASGYGAYNGAGVGFTNRLFIGTASASTGRLSQAEGGGGSHTHTLTNPTASFTGTAHNHTATSTFTGTAHNHTATSTFTGTAHNHTATSTFTGTAHNHTATSTFTGSTHGHTASSSSTFTGSSHGHTASSSSSFTGTTHGHTATSSSTFTGSTHGHSATSTFTGSSHGHTASSTFTGTTHNHSFSGSGTVDLDVQYVDVILATKD